MKRHAIEHLLAWQHKINRKPLILMGVRQTGKTYLLEQFGREHFTRYHLINFEKQPSAKAIFSDDLKPQQLFERLCFYLNTTINLQQDLVIFDEIQACPAALTSLKYFCEDLPQLALCSAGSLLGLHLNEMSYPVGKVDEIHLYPMTFSEFLSGIGDNYASDFLANLQLNTITDDLVHARLWQRLKEYFITGGLPEIVSLYAQQQESTYIAMQSVRQKQRELINAYYADIAKHSGKINAMHIDRTWRAIPQQLSLAQDHSSKRFFFRDIIPGIQRYAQLISVIDWLIAAKLVLKLPIVNTAEQPLLAFSKENLFKLMMFDIGILGAMVSIDPITILNYDYHTYQGFFAENFVLQELMAQNIPSIGSWQKGRSEIEFLLQHQGEIIPIEVKSGKITRTQSLQSFIEKYHPPHSVILSANKSHIDVSQHCYRLPLYTAGQLLKWL